jgi:hypothetical protein
MKVRHYLVSAGLATVALMTCAGCANNQPSAASANENPAAKTYTGDDLSRTGKRDAGEALRSADPSVTTTTGR